MADEQLTELLYTFFTDQGIIIPDVQEVATRVRANWSSALGGKLSMEPSTIQGRFIEAITRGLVDALGLSAATANQFNINQATGQFLDAQAALFLLERHGASSTSVTCELYGTPGTVIPSGAIAMSTAGDRFVLLDEKTLPENGYITAEFQAEETGPIPLPANTLIRIVTQVTGWDSINNPTAGTLGQYQESDYEFKKRIGGSRYYGRALSGSIESALADVSGVNSFFFYNNGKDEVVTVRGVQVLKHSVVIVVDGGSDTDVANALYRTISGGCNFTGLGSAGATEITVTIQDPSNGTPNPITFNRPKTEDINTTVLWRNNGYSGDDVVADIKNAIINWAEGNLEDYSGLTVGSTVSPFDIVNAITQQVSGIIVANLMIGLDGQEQKTQEIPLSAYQLGVFVNDKITVTETT